MTLLSRLPAEMIARLERNHQANCVAREVEQPELDHKPVVKLIVPTGRATWLLTEFDRDSEQFFRLCDLGMGCPELGYVALSDLDSLRGPLGSLVDYDMTFVASKPISAYADDARRRGFIAA
ncbi:hypothetical protein GCM10010869_20940 [Mesorhizobium tianshanense]|uniref:DUF2958 family protein n=1 Tax=Mesorhizobium tianshanense TaxID=39844 RepID=A0A562M7A8_9HYPH|nr:DUF2958 domain-containing protein [Mesorhizobium tianshanense]TWI15817.1 Protein of unknown function (DUF2958) [Mesorhizobium tianshanense]GLS36505.1 hypothetical protein GCM10010869_20940 [Mesorhizobium tianshanense]